MDNIVKLIYCLQYGAGKGNAADQLRYYYLFTTLRDKRVLKLGIGLRLIGGDLSSSEQFIDYLVNKDKYTEIAREKWKQISREIDSDEEF